MTVPLVSQNFSDVLDVRFREIAQGTYDLGKSRIGDFYTEKTSDRDTERYSSLTPLGLFEEFLGSIPYNGIEQEYDVTATHVEFANGLQIRRKLYDDAQFPVIDEAFGQLGDSAFKTQQSHAVGIFTGSFSATNDFYSHTENVALCSNSHTTPVADVSTATGYDNLMTAELDPTSLEAGVIQFQQMKDGSGWMIGEKPDKLLVPINLRKTADEIVGTDKGLFSAEGTKNVYEGAFQVVDWGLLSDANDWWLINTARMKKNLLWFWRIKLELARMESFDNIIAKARGYMRYSYLRRDWRWIVGSQKS